MVTMRILCYLLIFLVLQLHSKASNANFRSQGLQDANSEGVGASTNTHFVSKASENVIVNRKTLTHVNVYVKTNEKNGLKIESKETVKKRKNKKRLTKTVSLTADYNDPGHHPPRHN